MENITRDSDPVELQQFEALCLACRIGDLEKVTELVTSGGKLNQVDEWDYLPLILASLCGHLEVVTYLLANGAICDRETFEGERCVYGALNDEIRNVLLSYDMSKAMEVANPFVSHFMKLSSDIPTINNTAPTTKDIVFVFNSTTTTVRYLRAHRFVLSVRSKYFSRKLLEYQHQSTIMFTDLIPTKHPLGYYREFTYVVQYLYLNLNNRTNPKDLKQTRLFEVIELLELDPTIKLAIELEISEESNQSKSKIRNDLRKGIVVHDQQQFRHWHNDHLNGVMKSLDVNNDGDEDTGIDVYQNMLPSEEKTQLL